MCGIIREAVGRDRTGCVVVPYSFSPTECNARPPAPLQVYTSEQYERLTSWAARAESGSAMAHLWSPDDGTFLSRYVSTSSAAQNSSEVGWWVGGSSRVNWKISPENVIDSAAYFLSGAWIIFPLPRPPLMYNAGSNPNANLLVKSKPEHTS